MTDRSAAAAEVIAGLDFGSATVVADIGGGYGSVIAAVLDAHPDLRGILLDRGGVLPGAGQWLAGRDLRGRCELVEGDYLNPGDIPAADVYLLGSISGSPLNPALCAKTSRLTSPAFTASWSPDADVPKVYVCGDWDVIPTSDGWFGWTKNSPQERAAAAALLKSRRPTGE